MLDLCGARGVRRRRGAGGARTRNESRAWRDGGQRRAGDSDDRAAVSLLPDLRADRVGHGKSKSRRRGRRSWRLGRGREHLRRRHDRCRGCCWLACRRGDDCRGRSTCAPEHSPPRRRRWNPSSAGHHAPRRRLLRTRAVHAATIKRRHARTSRCRLLHDGLLLQRWRPCRRPCRRRRCENDCVTLARSHSSVRLDDLNYVVVCSGGQLGD